MFEQHKYYVWTICLNNFRSTFEPISNTLKGDSLAKLLYSIVAV